MFLFAALTGLMVACTDKADLLDFSQSPNENGYEKQLVQNRGLDQDRYVVMKGYNLKVHYRIIGKGPIDMVFTPGWTNPLTVYSKQFDFFRNKARSIYIDLPGHGLSDAPEGIEYTQELLADAIFEVLKKEGVKKFTAVGFSWGGRLLTKFQMKYPGMIREMILLDIGITTWPPMTQELLDLYYQRNLAMTPEEKEYALSGLIPPATAPADLLEWGQYFRSFPNWLLANLSYHSGAEEVCQPYPWNIPILVIYRAMGPVKEARTRLYYPNCVIQVIGGNQHVIQWAYHETVNQLMADFMIDWPGKKY